MDANTYANATRKASLDVRGYGLAGLGHDAEGMVADAWIAAKLAGDAEAFENGESGEETRRTYLNRQAAACGTEMRNQTRAVQWGEEAGDPAAPESFEQLAVEYLTGEEREAAVTIIKADRCLNASKPHHYKTRVASLLSPLCERFGFDAYHVNHRGQRRLNIARTVHGWTPDQCGDDLN